MPLGGWLVFGHVGVFVDEPSNEGGSFGSIESKLFLKLGIDEPVGHKVGQIFVGIGLGIVTQKMSDLGGFFLEVRFEKIATPIIPANTVGHVMSKFVDYYEAVTLSKINGFVLKTG